MDNTALNKRAIMVDLTGPLTDHVLVDPALYGGGGFGFVKVHVHDFNFTVEGTTNVRFNIGNLIVHEIEADGTTVYNGTDADLHNPNGGKLMLNVRDAVRVHGTIWYSMK